MRKARALRLLRAQAAALMAHPLLLTAALVQLRCPRPPQPFVGLLLHKLTLDRVLA